MLRLKSTTNQEPIGPCISYAPLEHQEKQKILALREDEQDFFISVTDFLRTFTHIEVVHLDADTGEQLKVHIFCEDHKFLRNLHLTFDWHYIGQK